MRIKTNGDAIAHEFLKLMGKSPTLTKKAQQEVTKGDTTVSVDSVKDDSINDDEIADLVSAQDDSKDNALMGQFNEALDDMGMNVEDEVVAPKTAKRKDPSFISPKGLKVMHGLGKIAASLRSKGENFAADVVETTAMSIGNDLKKEASEKKKVVTHLSKIASKLDNAGDKFAGDLVRTTIANIIK